MRRHRERSSAMAATRGSGSADSRLSAAAAEAGGARESATTHTVVCARDDPSLLCRFDPGYRVAAADLLRLEADLVAGLDLVEQGRVLDLEHHGHRRHVELLERPVLDGDLLGVL